MSSNFQQLKLEGEELGLSGVELKAYINECRLAESQRLTAENLEQVRLKNQAALEIKQLEIAQASEKLKLETEKLKMEAEIAQASEKLKLEAAQASEKLKMEFEMLKLQSETKKLENAQLAEIAHREKRLDIEANQELEARRAETAERQAQLRVREMEFELQKQTVSAEVDRMRLERNLSPASPAASVEEGRQLGKKVDIGPLRTPCDRLEVENYLQKFKRLCILADVPTRQMGVILAGKLQGDLTQIFNRIPIESAGDYDVIEAAILRKYSLDASFYKEKFRRAVLEAGETCQELFARMRDFLGKWLTLEKVEPTYESLLDFIIRDQFYYKSVSDVGKLNFIRERVPESLDKIAELAEVYDRVHAGQKKTQAPAPSATQAQNKYGKGPSYGTLQAPPARYQKPAGAETSFKPPDWRNEKMCEQCGRRGHTKQTCYQLVGRPTPAQSGSARNGPWQQSSGPYTKPGAHYPAPRAGIHAMRIASEAHSTWSGEAPEARNSLNRSPTRTLDDNLPGRARPLPPRYQNTGVLNHQKRRALTVYVLSRVSVDARLSGRNIDLAHPEVRGY